MEYDQPLCQPNDLQPLSAVYGRFIAKEMLLLGRNAAFLRLEVATDEIRELGGHVN